MCASATITMEDLPEDILKKNISTSEIDTDWKSNLQAHIRHQIQTDKNIIKKVSVEIEKVLIDESLKASNGVKLEAAKLLGWGRNTLARKAKGIN